MEPVIEYWAVAEADGLLLGIYNKQHIAEGNARILRHQWRGRLKDPLPVDYAEFRAPDGTLRVTATVRRRWWQQTLVCAQWIVYRIDLPF